MVGSYPKSAQALAKRGGAGNHLVAQQLQEGGSTVGGAFGRQGQREFESPIDFAFVKESLGVSQKRDSV